MTGSFTVEIRFVAGMMGLAAVINLGLGLAKTQAKAASNLATHRTLLTPRGLPAKARAPWPPILRKS